jgi:hypothetical protein
MNSDDQSPPQPRRKKWLVPALCVLAILAVGIGLPLAWTALSGKSAWEKTQAALRARGEKLTFDEFAHPLPPPARNFFADPLWTKFTASIQTSPGNNFVIFPPALPAGSPSLDDLDKPPAISLLKIAEIILPADQQSNLSISMKAPYFSNTVSRVLPKTTDPATRRMLATFVVAGLTGTEPLRAKIEQLLRDRPEAEFPLDYSSTSWPSFPHISCFLTLAKSYGDLANAHLVLGDHAAATADILSALRLARTLEREPFLISMLVRMSIIGMVTGPIATGIKQHTWTAAELDEFSSELARIDLVRALTTALRGERGVFNRLINFAKSGKNPSVTWAGLANMGTIGGATTTSEKAQLMLFASLYPFTANTDQNFYNLHFQALIDSFSSADGIHPASVPKLDDNAGLLFRATHFLTMMGTPGTESMMTKTAANQEGILQTRTACALEKYWLAHHSYPASLAALAPGFTPPKSVLAFQAINYRLEKDGTFRLWSPGWNETDEGGKISPTRGDYKTGDWVWSESPGMKP